MGTHPSNLVMNPILIIFAHPHFQHSRVNRALIDAVQAMPGIRIHDLYERYPDFYIDTDHEKKALTEAHTLILHHPFQWYSCPPLMKEWIDQVLEKGWAYGEGGSALHGKRWLHAITTGGTEEAYQREGHNRFTMDELMRPFEQTAWLCGMEYQPPFIFHDALQADHDAITRHAQDYRQLLAGLSKQAAQ
jgi:glutathione-regulated potassium-efflux system ancillary protein KefG